MRTYPKLTATLVVLCASAMAGATPERTFEKVVPAEATGIVEISNISGSIEVTGWDRPEVSVRAELGAGVERVDVDSDKGRTNVKVVLPAQSSRDGDAHLHVRVPKGSELHVSAVSAALNSSGVTGLQRINTVSGNATTEISGADLELKTVSGDVKIKGHGQPARLHLSTVSGDVHLDHGAGELDAGTVSGNLVVSLDSARSVRARTTSGDLHFEGKLDRGANVDAATVSGALNVRGAAAGGYAYEVSTFSGEISDCFAVRTEKSGVVGKSISGSRGEGSGRVRLKTMSGDIELCDRN